MGREALCGYCPSALRATCAGCHDTAHDTLDHLAVSGGDTRSDAGADIPGRCTLPAQDDSGTE